MQRIPEITEAVAEGRKPECVRTHFPAISVPSAVSHLPIPVITPGPKESSVKASFEL